MANLRAGLIGLGMMGRHHARVLSGLEGVDLVAVADPGGDKHGVAGGRPLLSSIDELIAVGLDYCMVAVPTIYHEPVGLALAAAGVHAMIEKPLAQNTGTSSATTRHCSPPVPVWRPASWVRSTRSPPGARGRSRLASPTSAWSRTWQRTTST